MANGTRSLETLLQPDRAPLSAAQFDAAVFIRTILESAPDGLAVVDADGHIVLVNQRIERMFGYAREELLGRPIELLVPERLRRLHASHRLAYQAAPRTRPMGAGLDLRARRKDGSELPVEISLSPVVVGGRALVIAVVRDISERKEAEQRAQQLFREQVLRAEAEAGQRRQAFLAEVSARLSSSLDVDGTLRRVAELMVPSLADWCVVDVVEVDGSLRRAAVAHPDPELAHLLWELGQPRQIDPSGPHPHAVVARTGHPIFQPEATEDVLRAFAQDEASLPLVRRLERAAGIVVPLIARGRTLGVLDLATRTPGRYTPVDFSLAQDVAQRCALAMDNARLFEEAQAAVRLRDEFLSTASHELKTPVTAIKGYAQLMRRWGLAEQHPRLAGALEVLQRQSDRLTRLVDDLLEVSRFRLGGSDFRPRRFELGELAAQVLDQLEALSGRHRLTLRHEAPAVVQADRERVEQVLTNLLSNAIKYSPDGGEVEVRVGVEANRAVVSVRDQGVGIPRERQTHLFERFYRAHAGTQHDYGGLGIGLYVSREIVVRHGGSISFESQEEQGSTFRFTLPLAGTGTRLPRDPSDDDEQPSIG